MILHLLECNQCTISVTLMNSKYGIFFNTFFLTLPYFEYINIIIHEPDLLDNHKNKIKSINMKIPLKCVQ